MSNKPVRTVSAVCACGASFDREVKRGRPQKWCPTCVAVPFYERQTVEVVAVVGEHVAEKVTSEWDDLAHVRDDIEAAMAIVNADHKARFASLVETGVDPYVAADQITDTLNDEIRAVYVMFRGRY